MINSRRMRLAGHVARKETGEVQTGLWRVGLKERDHLEDTGLEERIIVKWICKNWDGEA
jgi:hypothetical protein